MTFKLFPDPGKIPIFPPPEPGERLFLNLPDLPPKKERHRSCRNPKHPHYDRFVRLREASTEAMAGRQWFSGAVGLKLVINHPSHLHWEILNQYLGGIMDTLDGSHGAHFTYLPIAYQDDAQVAFTSKSYQIASESSYSLEISFLSKNILDTSLNISDFY